MIRCFPLGRGSYAPAANVIGGWRVSSWFGGRLDPISGRPGNHGGMDFPVPLRTPYYAVDDGQVSLLEPSQSGGGGRWVGLTCADGDYAGYGHLLEFSVRNGQRVRAGDLIGLGDSTGHSTGHHLHFSYRRGGQYAYTDPYDLLLACAVNGFFPGETPEPHNPDKPLPEVAPACGPGCKDKTLHILGCDESGDYWEISDLFKRHVSTTEEKEILRTNLGIEDRGVVSGFILDTRVDVSSLT